MAKIIGGVTSSHIPAVGNAIANNQTTAVVGVTAAIGAYGAFLIPKSYGTSIAMTGGPQAALRRHSAPDAQVGTRRRRRAEGPARRDRREHERRRRGLVALLHRTRRAEVLIAALRVELEAQLPANGGEKRYPSLDDRACGAVPSRPELLAPVSMPAITRQN